MADLQFVANGLAVPDAIKFYPRDASGNVVTGVNIALSGAGCAGATVQNVRTTTDDDGVECLVADLIAPSSVPNGSCEVVASAGETTCRCSVTFLAQALACPTSFDQGQPCVPGETFTGVFVFLDQEGNPYVGDDIQLALSNNASLVSFTNVSAAGEWTFEATAGDGGTVVATITSPNLSGTCTIDVKSIEPSATLDCDSLQASGSYGVCGEEASYSFTISDTDGNPVTQDLVVSGSNVTILTQQFLNGEWVGTFIPTGSNFSLSVQDCNILTATALRLDCASLDVTTSNYTIGSSGQIRFKLDYDDGSPVVSGPSFTGVGANISSAVYTNGEWIVSLVPTASTFSIEIGHACGKCVISGSATTGNNNLDCANVTCEPIGGALVVGRQGKFVVTVNDDAGNPVSSGVDFQLTGATLEQAAYSATLQGWVLDITPTAETIVGSILTSNLGSCNDFCSLSATTPQIDCSLVTCDVVSQPFELGEEQTVVVIVTDTTGSAITENVAFDFTGATVGSTVYSASLGAWVIELTPTANTVVGNSIVTALGVCNNFCTIDTTVVDRCCKEIQALQLASPIVGAAYAGAFRVSDVDTSIIGLPAGLTYNSTTGVISGTPTTAGSSDVTFRYGECDFTTTITVVSPQSNGNNCCPKMNNISIPTGIVGDPYVGFAAFSGQGARTYQAINMPPGITINPSTGNYEGVPTQAGNFESTLTVTDSRGSCTYTVTFDIDNERQQAQKPSFTAIPQLVSVVGDPVNLMLFASTGSQFVARDIGNGLSIDTTGAIRGTPDNAGVTSFDVTIVDGDGNQCVLTLSYTVLGSGGTPTSDDHITSLSMCVCCGRKTIIAIGSTAASYTTEGDLPDGIEFSGGALVGTPTRKGSFKFTVKPGNGTAVEVMLVVEDCCDGEGKVDESGDSCVIETDDCKEFTVRLIDCVSIHGIEYQASLDQPSNPLRVTAEERDYLLANGYAIACKPSGD